MNNYCMKCGGQLKTGMTVCPLCGTPINSVPTNNQNNNYNNNNNQMNNTVPPKKTPAWVIVLIVLGVLFVIGVAVGSDNKTSNSSSGGSSSTTKEKFSYTVDKQYESTFSYYIEGIVTNNRDKDYSYVQIEFICYDKAGNSLGTALANTNNLLGNKTWKYKALLLNTSDDKVDHCDFHEITGW
ncbi:MAG: hypothetical protein J6X02_01155 [Bacilli bacterium]|nr:hypothetical protein [Bacilli bacterium]